MRRQSLTCLMVLQSLSVASCAGEVAAAKPNHVDQADAGDTLGGGSSSGSTRDASVDANGLLPMDDVDGATSDVSPPDASTTSKDWIPVFVATGHAGRTVISCDDGQHFIEDRSADDQRRCFSDGVDCDHQSDANTGLAYIDGYFFATFGWGAPGTIRRSRDGVQWDRVLDGSAGGPSNFAGLSAGAGLVLAGASSGKVTADQGTTWQDLGDTMLEGNVRTGGFGGYSRGVFVISAEDGDLRATRVSDDGGRTWRVPSVLPASCGHGPRRIAYGNGTLLLPGSDGVACSSQDGGETWQANQVFPSADGQLDSGAYFIEGMFHAWGYHPSLGRALVRSSDGKTWSAEKTTDVVVGAVAHNPNTGTFVTVNDGWQQWYEKQRFYRSRDGVTWQELEAGSYRGGHPIRHLAFGLVPPNAVCP